MQQSGLAAEDLRISCGGPLLRHRVHEIDAASGDCSIGFSKLMRQGWNAAWNCGATLWITKADASRAGCSI